MAIEQDEIEQAPVATPETTEPKQLVVDLEDDEEENQAVAEAPEGKKGRRQAYREVRNQLKEEREARAALERQIAELRGHVQGIAARPAPVAAQPQVDPAEEQINDLWTQQQEILRQANTDDTLTAAQRDKLSDKWRKLDRERRKLETERDIGGREPAQQQTREDIENEILNDEFPEVFADPVLIQRAKAELMALSRAQKRAPNLTMAREAARRVSPKRPAAAPSEADKAKHAGTPGRPGTVGGSGGFVPTKMQLSAARAYTDHLPNLTDEERVRKWVKDVGKPNGLV